MNPTTRPKVAVIGAGISGIAAADRLSASCDVSLYEAEERLGGHTDTHTIELGEDRLAVDSGFIVFNERNYPNFSAWLAELGVASQASDMSFGVRNVDSGVEYASTGPGGLFCQPRNLIAPRFWRMLGDIRRFYRDAERAAAQQRDVSIGDYLRAAGYGSGFIEDHMGPMCAALWSQPVGVALDIPLGHVVAFMSHHLMLQLDERPRWQVVQGGSRRYIDAFVARFGGSLRPADPVQRIDRAPVGVTVSSRRGTTRYDAVFLACHSDQALRMLGDPSVAEREVLGAVRYQRNRVVVHSDASVMPRRRAAWASWNVRVGDDDRQARVSYWMNRLQSLRTPLDVFVTLNPVEPLERIWRERSYAHPVFDGAARMAQRRKHEINGVNRTYYCGAYWGWGFHEDGFTSALAAVRTFQGQRTGEPQRAASGTASSGVRDVA